MKVPKNNVITRAGWRSFRDGAGGKAGMAKVNIGSALDSWHKIYAKGVKAEDPAMLVKHIDVLSKKVNSYIAEVTKKDKAVAKVAKTKLKTPVDKFAASLTKMAAEHTKALNKQLKNVESACFFVKRNSSLLVKRADVVRDELGKISSRYRRTVPDQDKPQVLKVVQNCIDRPSRWTPVPRIYKTSSAVASTPLTSPSK